LAVNECCVIAIGVSCKRYRFRFRIKILFG
jgi:hypothetical protein